MTNKTHFQGNMPTIKDVAVAAGVSLKTVSRVINNSDKVRPEMREKVLAKIKTMGYRPNAIARSLRVKKTFTIGVIIADISNNFYSAIVRGIEDVAADSSYSVIIASNDELLKKERQYSKIFIERQVDGMIIVPSSGSHDYLEEMAGHLPMVFVDRQPEGIRRPCVKVDNEKGAYDLTLHLLAHGYREIAYIGLEQNLTTGWGRFSGFQKAIREYGVELKEKLIKVNNVTQMDAFNSVKAILRELHRPQAIFAANNIMALGSIHALNTVGLEIPRDIALASFDDFITASTFRPRLTVIAQPAYEMGQKAAALLFQQMESGEFTDGEIILQTAMVRRESCGCLVNTPEGQSDR